MTGSLEDFAIRVGAPTPTPAGGAVAGVAVGLAAALVEMIAGIAQRRDKTGSAALPQLLHQAGSLRQRLLQLAEDDSEAFAAVIEARRNTAGGEAERAARLQRAWRHAAQVPAEVLRLARDVAELAGRAARDGPPSTLGDAVMAALLAAAVATGSHLNLRFNVEAAGGPADLRVLVKDTEVLLRDAQRAASDVRLLAEEKLGRDLRRET
jgi:methenyltetrahydrofolate cyclohydrolase